MARSLSFTLLLLAAFSLAACGDRRAPAPTPFPVQSAQPVANLTGDVLQGANLWRDRQCVACHGPVAMGGIGGKLANTALPFDRFLSQIRNALPPKPAMSASDLSDNDAYSIYLWLHTLGADPARAPTPPVPAALPTGQVLGIQLWTQYGCNACHGAFGQGSVRGPALAGETYPFERERAVMRLSADQNPVHTPDHISDEILRRLLDWLRRGADPAGGC